RPTTDLLLLSYIFKGYSLILVDKENTQLGRLDNLLYLVFAQIAEQSGFLIEPVGFVHNQDIHDVRGGIYVCSGPFEEVIDVCPGERTSELASVYRPRCGISCHVVRNEPSPGEVDEEVDRDDRLSRSGASLYQQDLLFSRYRCPRKGNGGFENNLLVIDHLELALSLQ